MQRMVMQECAFADDAAVVANGEGSLQDSLKVWKELEELMMDA